MIKCIVCKKEIPASFVAVHYHSDSGMKSHHVYCEPKELVFYKLKIHGQIIIETLNETLITLKSELENRSEDKNYDPLGFTITPVSMNQMAFDALPEFEGF